MPCNRRSLSEISRRVPLMRSPSRDMPRSVTNDIVPLRMAAQCVSEANHRRHTADNGIPRLGRPRTKVASGSACAAGLIRLNFLWRFGKSDESSFR